MGLKTTQNISGKFSGIAANQEVSPTDLAKKLKGCFLVRSYAKDADPYAVISDLPETEGLEIARKNDPQRGEDNYRKRIITENWLRQGAEKAGVDMQKATPAYFAFTDDLDFVLSHLPEHKEVIVIPAEKLDFSSWTFTMDDHFFAEFSAGEKDCTATPSHAKPHPLHGHVLSAAQLVQALETYRMPQNPFENNFEAQMWSKEPVLISPHSKINLGVGQGLRCKVNKSGNSL